MRVDRILSLYFFHPLMKTIMRPRDIRIPILMYHSISDEPESGHPYFWINTSPKRFAEHMRLLKENNYKVISLTDAAEILKFAPIIPDNPVDNVPQKYVVVTFDDGFADFQTRAFPILKKYGFSATVFLPTGFISNEMSIFKGKKCLRWCDVCELAESGVQFGSHSVTHPKLRDLQWDQIKREIEKSTKTLEDKLGKRVESFSYPYAFPEKDVRLITRLKALLVKLSYKNGVTTKIGTAMRNDDQFFLRRIPANSDVDHSFFLAKLGGGYNWMQSVQNLYKRI